MKRHIPRPSAGNDRPKRKYRFHIDGPLKGTPRVVLSARGYRKRRLQLATMMRVKMEQETVANLRRNMLRMNETQALAALRHLPSVELIANDIASGKFKKESRKWTI